MLKRNNRSDFQEPSRRCFATSRDIDFQEPEGLLLKVAFSNE